MNLKTWSDRLAFLLALFMVTPALYGQDENPSGSSDPNHPAAKVSPARVRQPALERTQVLMETVRAASFPGLNATQIQVRALESNSHFFRARLRIPDFFVKRRIRYVLKVNPKVYELQAPEDGLKAIMAHELSHVAYLRRKKRIQLLGMVRLLSSDFISQFERRTDLEAISRGYGEGLKAFRQWLYQHIPQKSLAEKRRNYFSPEEVSSILLRIGQCPQLLDYWLKKPPRNPQEIQLPSSSQGGP